MKNKKVGEFYFNFLPCVLIGEKDKWIDRN